MTSSQNSKVSGSFWFRPYFLPVTGEYRLLFRRDKMRTIRLASWGMALLSIGLFLLPPPEGYVLFWISPALLTLGAAYAFLDWQKRTMRLLRRGVIGYRITPAGIFEIGGEGL